MQSIRKLTTVLTPAAFSSFVLGNGLIMIACGAAAGALFNGLIEGIVDHAMLPATYATIHIVSKNAAERAFRNVKKDFDSVSLVQTVMKFTIGMTTLYLVVVLIMNNVLQTLLGGSAPR